MAYTTQTAKLFPWNAGVNLTDDIDLLDVNDCVAMEHAVVGTKGNPKMRQGISRNYDSAATVVGKPIVGGTQFRFGSIPKTDQRISVDSDGNFYSYTSGGVRTLHVGGVVWTGVTSVSFGVLNNILLIGVNGVANTPKQWDGVTLSDLPNAPNFSICRVHQGRMMTNDKVNPDELHYSETFDPTVWLGEGDSGAIPLDTGDGDEGGLTAIFPTFKGDLFVAKLSKLGRISGDGPENWVIEIVSNGIGAESHNAVTSIDDRDVVWLSRRGIHSLLATGNYGDFESSFLSRKISKVITERWPTSRMYAAQASYVPELDSVAFAVTDSTYDNNSNRVVWLYNVGFQRWYYWPNIDCQSMFVARDADKNRLYLGGSDNRLAQTFNGLVRDITTTGANVAIPFLLRTGMIYVDARPEIIKGFKRLGLAMRLTADTTVVVKVTIDNFAPTTYNVTNLIVGPLLGSTFVLGLSSLGASTLIAPFSFPIEGYGRGIQVEISKNETVSDIDLQGLFLEYESAELAQEMRGA